MGFASPLQAGQVLETNFEGLTAHGFSVPVAGAVPVAAKLAEASFSITCDDDIVRLMKLRQELKAQVAVLDQSLEEQEVVEQETRPAPPSEICVLKGDPIFFRTSDAEFRFNGPWLRWRTPTFWRSFIGSGEQGHPLSESTRLLGWARERLIIAEGYNAHIVDRRRQIRATEAEANALDDQVAAIEEALRHCEPTTQHGLKMQVRLLRELLDKAEGI